MSLKEKYWIENQVEITGYNNKLGITPTWIIDKNIDADVFKGMDKLWIGKQG